MLEGWRDGFDRILMLALVWCLDLWIFGSLDLWIF